MWENYCDWLAFFCLTVCRSVCLKGKRWITVQTDVTLNQSQGQRKKNYKAERFHRCHAWGLRKLVWHHSNPTYTHNHTSLMSDDPPQVSNKRHITAGDDFRQFRLFFIYWTHKSMDGHLHCRFKHVFHCVCVFVWEGVCVCVMIIGWNTLQTDREVAACRANRERKREGFFLLMFVCQYCRETVLTAFVKLYHSTLLPTLI